MASALAEAVSKVPFFLPETWPSERLPQMTRLICRQIEEQWPPFVDHDSPLEGNCVDGLRGSRAFLAWDRHAGCGFVSGLFARPMAAGLDGLSASRGSHLDFALDAPPLAAGLPR